MLKNGNWAMVAGLLISGAITRPVSAQVQFHSALGSVKYSGCSDVKNSDFTSVSLVTKAKVPDLFEPTRFAIAKSGRIFFAERNGGVRVVEIDGSIKQIGSVNIFPTTNTIPGNNELGLVGLQLDPNFDATGFIYLIYQPPTPAITKVSRFKVNGQIMDMASEQVILSLPNQRSYCCHTGGSMQFDNKGDLWISIGNNTRNSSDANGYVDESSPDKDDQAHSANTNDYRGKILRIHPLVSAGTDGKFYTIPSGNLKEYYASMWSATDMAKVLPEIYTMGHRSNYTLTVDTAKGWLTWGDIGPDEGRQTEELNITTKPGYFGWPYFAGSKRTDAADPYAYKPALNKDDAAPVNTSPNNTGVQKLPPAIPATFGYKQAAAVTGPIYHWSAAQTNQKRLPPHFDGKWLVTDFNIGELQVATLDANANLTGRVTLFDGLTRPLQIVVGPDGVLYTLEYASSFFVTDGKTAIKRWDYTGPACQGTGLAEEQATKARLKPNSILLNLDLGSKRSLEIPAGKTGIGLYDVQGKEIWDFNSHSGATSRGFIVDIPESVPHGLYRVLFR